MFLKAVSLQICTKALYTLGVGLKCLKLLRSFMFPFLKQGVKSGEELGSVSIKCRTWCSSPRLCCGSWGWCRTPCQAAVRAGEGRKGLCSGHTKIHRPLHPGCDSDPKQMQGDRSQGEGGIQSYFSCFQWEENPDSEVVSSFWG